jgi:Aspartyl/Asparaginyl beta-hydroxylase
MGASEPGAPPISFCRLPLRFAADELARDLAGIAADAWITHFNAGYHDGGWSGVALRAVDGNAEQLYPGHLDTASHADTPLLARCPRIRAALARLYCPVQSVRLLRLSAGGVIHEHRDEGLRLELGLARLHVPIATGRDVEFYLAGDLVTMTQGECWYLNFDLPHRVQNLGRTDRVHLVIDCEVNDWLRALILTAAESGCGTVAGDADSSQRRFERFRDLVLDDQLLTDALWPIDEPDVFVERVVALGRQHGFRFTAEDVQASMRAGGRVGAGRWIVT